MKRRSLIGNIFLAAALLATVMPLCTGAYYMSAHADVPAAAAQRKLRVAFPVVPGISEYDAYGRNKGVLVDYLNEISKYTDWEYEYIETDGEKITDEFMAGKFDLVGGTYYMPLLEEEYGYLYPQYSMGNSVATLVCRNDDDSLKSYNLQSANGKKIGVYVNATEKARRLKVFLDSNGLDCEIVYFSKEQMAEKGDLYSYLRNGDVDLLLGNIADIKDDFSLFASFDDQPYYIVTRAGGEDILASLNYALEKILEINPDFAEEVYNRNVGDIANSYVRLSAAEREYVAARGTVKVAIMRNWHPFYCIDPGNVSHNGIVPDVLAHIGKFSGLGFEYVFTDSYGKALDAVRSGKADVLGCFSEGEEEAFELGFARTEPYASLNNTIVKNKSVNFPDRGLVGGVVRGRKLEEGLTDKEPVYFDTTREALDAVESGKIDFFSGLSAVIEREVQLRNYVNLTFVSSVNTSLDVALALTRPVDTQLYSVLNKSLRSISPADKLSISNMNIVSEGIARSASLSEIIAANPVAFAMIICAVFALVTGGMLVFVRFRYRAKVMHAELEKAEARSRAKTDFLSRMSHEIRTPMNAIVGLTDLVSAEPELPPGAREKINKIRSSSDYMLSLINDILDMSRIENEKLTLEPESFSLRGMLDEIDKMTDVLVARKGVVCEMSRDIRHDNVRTDPLRLRQVLVNLVSNAVKFTHRGKRIFLSANETASDAETATFEFSVADEGVGIAPEDRERIFNAFEQAGTNISKSDGTGLGLAISSSIVRVMGGELRVESEVGRGSRFSFTVTFPLGQEPPAQETGAGGDCLEGIRVLLAEDNDINAEIASELLSMYGASSERAVNGQAATEMFAASPQGYYDVILMDLKMPVKDGLEATREIRASVHPDAAAVPVIAMTANSFVEDRRAAEDAGMNGFVPKPVNMELLVATVRDLIGKRRAADERQER